MQYSNSSDKLSFQKWDLSFSGIPLDERGEKSIEFVTSNSTRNVIFKYISDEFKVKIDDSEFEKDDLDSQLYFLKDSNVLIDSTTLSFSEILIISQSLKNIGLSSLSVLYIEPYDYNKKMKAEALLSKRDFDLSESVIGFEAIPGHALLISNEIKQKVVFLCGYEAERMDRAFEDSQLNGAYCSCIFGVPAFCPGWEMDSFDNNIPVIKKRQIKGDIYFCGATNPVAVYQTLDNIYKSLDEEDQMFIVPLATKPMNLAACLFLLDKPKEKVAVLYDHPNGVKNGTRKFSKWHLFNLTLN